MKEAFQIPATGTVEYQYIRIPTGLTEDKWLAAIEIKPQARAQVHHVIAFTRAGRLADHRRRRARPRQHRRRHAEQARRGFRSGRRPHAERQLRHRAADALHDQRQGDDRQDAGRLALPERTADVAAARRQRDPAAVRDPGRRAGARSARLARAAGRHHHHVVHAAHARARQGHDLHGEVSRTAAPRCC